MKIIYDTGYRDQIRFLNTASTLEKKQSLEYKLVTDKGYLSYVMFHRFRETESIISFWVMAQLALHGIFDSICHRHWIGSKLREAIFLGFKKDKCIFD